jgi:hypothetical protein
MVEASYVSIVESKYQWVVIQMMVQRFRKGLNININEHPEWTDRTNI